MEEEVGFVDIVGRDDFFMKDGFHLTGKGAAVLGCEFVTYMEKQLIAPMYKTIVSTAFEIV